MSTSSTSARDKNAFKDAVVARFQARGWLETLDFDSEAFSLDLGKNGKLFLDNAYQDWLKADTPALQQSNIDKIVSMAFENAARMREDQSFEQVMPDILPAIRNRAYIDNLWMTVDDFPRDYMRGARQPLCDDLAVILTINAPASIATVSAQQLSEWGKTFDEVMVSALKNLRKFKKPDFQVHDGGFLYLNSDDFYDPSLLLMPDLFQTLPLKGEPVAIAVSRSLLLVTGSKDLPALQAMAELAESEYAKDTRPILLLPIILRDGHWQPFDGPSATYPMLERLHTLSRLGMYGDQLSILEAYNKKMARDVYVGQLEAIADGDELITWASLVDGICTLLPACEAVIMAPADLKKPFARRFSDVVAVCGEMPIEPDTWPPLYVFENGLTPAQSKRLRENYKLPPGFPDIGHET